MLQEETICCICKNEFSENSQPRMMPYCEHSACTSCLKQFVSRDKTHVIVCQHCGHEEKITEIDLEYFPKNICLTKMLKEKNNLIKNVASNRE
jgi:DNA-directed RNA polymerase subunit RPC12/RpoP